MRRASGLVAVLALLVPASAGGWGNRGHDIIAFVAFHRLSPAAQQAVRTLLGASTLATAASFADEVRKDRPETAQWHFVDIPRNAAAYDARRDCRATKRGDCVVKAIERCEAALRHGGSGCGTSRKEALMFLIHLVGDVHQPLHCATDQPDDRGGNDKRVCFFGVCREPDGRAKNLHGVWDSDILVHEGRSERAIIRAIEADLAGRSAAEIARMAAGGPVAWANETHALAVRAAYADLPRPDRAGVYHLGGAYEAKDAPVVDTQLTRAAVRLAAVLERLLDHAQ